MKKLIFNYKIIMLLIIITLVSFGSIFFIYIDYAIKSGERLKNTTIENSDIYKTQEELDKAKNKSLIENFVDLKNHFSVDTLYDNYTKIKLRMLPAVMLITVVIFRNLKNNKIKFNIGRNDLYLKEKNIVKNKLSLLTPIYSLIMVFILTMIGLLCTNSNFGQFFEFIYSKNDIINYILVNNISVFIVIEIFSFIGLYVLNLFLLELVDRYDTINAIILFFMLIWLIPSVFSSTNNIINSINMVMPSYILKIGVYFGESSITMILPIIILFITVGWMRRLEDNIGEVN